MTSSRPPSSHARPVVRRRRSRSMLLPASSLALVAIASAAVLGSAGQSSAAVPAPAAQPVLAVAPTATVTVPVAEDAYTVPAKPTRRAGSYTSLVAGDRTTDRRTVYLKFSVAGLPSGATGVHATLRMTTAKRTLVGAQVEVRSTGSAWTEATLDAAGAPAAGALLGSAPAPSTVGGVVSVPVGAMAAGTTSFAVSVAGAAGSSLPLVARESDPAAAASLVLSYSLPAAMPEFGESVYRDGRDWASAVAASDAKYGRSGIDRVYYPGLPQAWPGNAGAIGRDVVVSFKADPGQVLSGSLDATLRSWFTTAPADREVYWSYFHEPEDQVEGGSFTAADYRAAWVRLASIARSSGNPHLHATLILMAWTVNPKSGRSFADFYPGPSVIDVLGWDAYTVGADAARGAYTDPATVFGAAVATSQAAGKPFGFAEWGSVLAAGDAAGTGRAAWIRAAARYHQVYGAVWSTYFDAPVGAEYRLFDQPSIAAFRDVIAGRA